jgi:hypothetical protein
MAGLKKAPPSLKRHPVQRRYRSLFCPSAGITVYRRYALLHGKTKIEQIEFYGGRCHFVESACEIYAASETLARELNGHYMDQFTLPSAPPTGAAITTLPTAFSAR